jgi:xanthine dehydrogenase YagR molybdenum-binding subunit
VTTNPLPAIGPERNRVDGRLKVTGTARYAADWPVDGLAFGYIVQSTVANGRIASIDAARARREPGVIAVMTHENAPRVNVGVTNPNDRKMAALQEDVIHYDRQPVAVVIADSFTRAKYAASLVTVTYVREPARTRFEDGTRVKPKDIHGKPPDTVRGDADEALAQATNHVDNVYTTPIEHHNPMEPHATIAVWDGGKLRVYDGTQGTTPARKRIAGVFGMPADDVEVITKFAGGAFGSKGSVWSHTILCAMAAKLTGKPVQIALWRPQMFGPVGNRPSTRQRVALGAGSDGRLTAQIHETESETSVFDDFVEPCGVLTTMLYGSPALRVTHRMNRLNYGTPTYMRAPGESSGSFALESAMDELAYAAGLDPIDLRLRNYADEDPTERKPFSSKSLRECYERGAATFGWTARNPEPRSMRDGRYLIGMGMASSTYPTNRSKAAAVAKLFPDGSVTVSSSGVDIGTGAYTALTQIFAAGLGVPIESVTVQLGDSSFPEAPVAGGSQLTASLGSAMEATALNLKAQLAQMTVADPNSPLHGLAVSDLATADGRIFAASEPSRGVGLAEIVRSNGGTAIEVRGEAAPDKESPYSMHAFGAQFAMVRVDPELGTVRLVKQVGAFASGRIINAKTARSQYLGGMVFGIGMALLEETRPDERTGRFMNANLGEYLVPCHADVGSMEVVLVEEDDPHVNPIGVKGIGEIGLVGAAAAIANAVFHATGKRIRDLPITPPKLLLA